MAEMPLLSPYKMGRFDMSHRVVMAPMARNRAHKNLPQEHMLMYYSQRASEGGLIISEATEISENGCPDSPGIWTKEQVEAWKPIVQAVHDKGALIFCQLWHIGKVSNFFLLLSRQRNSKYSSAPKEELDVSDINNIVKNFRTAARNAIEAGFDGIEIHGAGGCMPDEFIMPKDYSGSLENHCRFVREVLEAVVTEIGPDRVGLRISPFSDFIDSSVDLDPSKLGLYLAQSANNYNIIYLHVVEPRMVEVDGKLQIPYALEPIRKAFKGTLIAAGGYDKECGNQVIESNYVDLVAYGRLFLSNPDLPKRFKAGCPLNNYDRRTFYTSEPVVGYTDYPFLESTA